MRHLFAFFTPILFSLATSGLTAQSWSIVGTGTLDSPDGQATAAGINDMGQIAGTSDVPAISGYGANHGFFWDDSRGLVDIPPIAPNLGWGSAIDENGVVYGHTTAIGKIVAYRFENDQTIDMHPDGAYQYSKILSVNRLGVVSGSAKIQESGWMSDPFRAYLSDGVRTNYLATFGGRDSFCYVIDDFNRIAGSAQLDTQPISSAPFLWDGTTLHNLGSLGGNAGRVNGLTSTSLGGAQDCIAVGSSLTASLHEQAVRFDINGSITALDGLGGLSSRAWGINFAQQIVGQADTPSGDPRAVLWENGVIVDLNQYLPSNSGWVLTNAVDINELGEICGNGDYLGESMAYRLSPPSTQPLMTAVLPGIAGASSSVTGRGFSPGQKVALVYGFALGSTPVPGFPGASLDIANAQIAFVELANSFGRIRFHFALPPRAHNVRLFAQALDLATGEMSLVTEQTIR